METIEDTPPVAPEAPGIKECTRCHTPKLLTDFYLGKKRKGDDDSARRRMSWCKECHKSFSRRRRQERLVAEGEAYLKSESQRVRGHLQDPAVAEVRSATARAARNADRMLRERHADEYHALLAQTRLAEGLPAA
jgi:hypothetical protein